MSNAEDTIVVNQEAIYAYQKRIEDLVQKNKELEDRIKNSVEMILQIQSTIDGPPVAKEKLYAQACSADGITFNSWEKTWNEHVSINGRSYNIPGKSCISELGKHELSPCIIAGSGPSLRKNYIHLKNRGKIPLVSCLHNYGFFEDNGITPEYYVNLDAGDVTISELSQGGAKRSEYYWESTENKTLVTAIIGHPELHKKWRGDILWYAPPPVNEDIYKKWCKMISPDNEYDPVTFNIGGNTLGACMYFAKAVLGSNPIAFVGADFSFSYTHKFHPFDSPYDAQFSGVIPWTDIWGNRVYTWGSYFGFKNFFEYIACGGKNNVPGIWINCTEGGILGSYTEGNIRQIIQMSLEHFVYSYRLHEDLPKTIAEHKGVPALTF